MQLLSPPEVRGLKEAGVSIMAYEDGKNFPTPAGEIGQKLLVAYWETKHCQGTRFRWSSFTQVATYRVWDGHKIAGEFSVRVESVFQDGSDRLLAPLFRRLALWRAKRKLGL